MDSVVEVLHMLLQSLSILLPRHSVHSRRSLSLQRVIAVPEQADRHVMQQGGELLLLVPAGCFPHTSKPLGHAIPTLCPVRVGLFGVPLGRTASLHPLRRGSLPIVRVFRRYYPFVRLPTGVRAGLIARRLLQPVRPTAAGHQRGLPVLAHGISRHAWGL